MPLRRYLTPHEVRTAAEMGWSTLSNGELLAQAEAEFDLLLTTDKNLSYQQNLTNRKLAILVLPTTKWPQIKPRTGQVLEAVNKLSTGGFLQMEWQ